MIKKNNGLTLVELIIALGLMALVSALVFSFFSINRKKINEVNIRADLQTESEVCFKYMSKYAMEASKGNAKEVTDKYVISFSKVFDNGTVLENGAVFTFDKADGQVIFKTTEDGKSYEERVICNDVKDLTSSCDDDGVSINLKLERSGIQYEVTDSFIYRNKHIK